MKITVLGIDLIDLSVDLVGPIVGKAPGHVKGEGIGPQ